MHQNEILTLLHKVVAENQQYTTWTVSTPHLVALVNQAIEKEREACIQIVENEAYQYSAPVWAFEIVNAIKDRGEQHESQSSK